MRSFRQFSFVAAALFALGFVAPRAHAETKTLIEMSGGTPTAGFAKAWKSEGQGKYEFTLDHAQKLKGKDVTPAMVKDSLEEKLGESMGVKVEPKGADKVMVTYNGDEAQFLDAVATTRIRPDKKVDLALERPESEGAIRAKTADRMPGADEVKGTIVGKAKAYAEVRVLAAGKSGFAGKMQTNKKYKIALPASFVAQRGETIFFKPTSEVGGVYAVKDVIKI